MSMMKTRNKLSRTFPNIAISHPLLTGLIKLDEVQARSKMVAFYQQLNDNSVLKYITMLRLKKLQQKMWNSKPLLEMKEYKVPPCYNNNFLLNMISLCLQHRFTFEISTKWKEFFTIPGKNELVYDICQENTNMISRIKQDLIRANIMFQHQVIHKEQNRVLSWSKIQVKNSYLRKSPPAWYMKLLCQITYSNSLDLLPLYRENLVNRIVSNFDFIQEFLLNYDVFKNSFIAYLAIEIDSNVEIIRLTSSSKGITDNNFARVKHFNIDASNRDAMIISQCEECRLKDEDNFNNCSFIIDKRKAVLIEDKFVRADKEGFRELVMSKVVASKNARDQLDRFNKYDRIIQGRNNSHQPIPYVEIITNRENFIQDMDELCILDYVQEAHIQRKLLNILTTNKEDYRFSFYTDGSLINFATKSVSVAGAFIQIGKSISDLSMLSKLGFTISYFPSAFKGEMLAILLTMFVVPSHSFINIYTDSQGAIDLMTKADSFNFKNVLTLI